MQPVPTIDAITFIAIHRKYLFRLWPAHEIHDGERLLVVKVFYDRIVGFTVFGVDDPAWITYIPIGCHRKAVVKVITQKLR